MYDYAVKKIAEHMGTIWITVSKSKVTFKVECAFNKCVSWSLNTHFYKCNVDASITESIFYILRQTYYTVRIDICVHH